MKRISQTSIYFTLIICLTYVVKYRWKGDDGTAWKSVIRSDGYGYYSYLPCIFIYHKFDYKRVLLEEQKNDPGAYCVTIWDEQNKPVDKCFSGVALLLTPFFLLAYFLSYLLGSGTGGYEFLFEASVSIGALFYMGLGLVFIRKLLKEYAISDWIIALSLILTVFATNLFYYSTMEPSLGHVYSFGLMAVFLYYAKKSVEDFRTKNLILMATAISVLVIIRPTNLISLLFIPFFTGSFNGTWEFIKKLAGTKITMVLVLIATIFVFLQMLLWHAQTGKFYADTYHGEGFNFSSPHFIDILFSYQNGWFVYSPVMLIAVLGGLTALFRQNKFRFFIVSLFFVVSTYVLSSWWAWWYGGAYGLRAYIDYYPAFALLMAICFNSVISPRIKESIILTGVLCIALNLFQTYQYNNFILPQNNLTKEKYWKIFLKSSNIYAGIFDYPDTTQYKFLDSLRFKNDYENIQAGNVKNLTNAVAHSYSHSILLDSINQNSPEFLIDGSKLKNLKNVSICVKLWVFMTDFDNDAKVIFHIRDKSWNTTLWSVKSLQGFMFKKNMWTLAYYVVPLPEIKSDDHIRVMVNASYGNAYIDDLEVSFVTPE